MRKVIFLLAPLLLLAGVGGAVLIRRRRMAQSNAVQPEVPPMGGYEGTPGENHQVEPYSGGERLGQREGEEHFAARV